MKILGEKVYTGFPWAAFVALSLGMIVFGLAESYGPLSALTQVVPSNLAWLAFTLPYIFGGIGAFISGYLADILGRKLAFILASGLVLLGMILYLPIWLNVVTGIARTITLLISIAIVGMAAIGLESPVLAMISESVSSQHRSKLLVLGPNFGNLGVALAYVPLLIFGINNAKASAYNYELALILMYIAPTIGLILAWLKATETLPWKAIKTKKNVEEAWKAIDKNSEVVNPNAGLGFRLLTLILIGIVQDVAFVYITYGASYAYFSNIAEYVPLIGGFTMTIVGIITGLFITSKVSRKVFAVISYSMLAVFWVLLWGVASITNSSIAILSMFTLLMIPVETTWATRALLEPELFPTNRRGMLISLVRFVVWVSAGIIAGLLILIPLSFTIGALSMFIIALAGVGGALFWYYKGFETGNKNLLGLDLQESMRKIAPVKASDPKDD
ncbi:MFS transporter [Caldisphaera lagunensis]|uniref:MFS transporter n=1 Tax=Caldisphaera lagunensis TaxID=200415 RepID=UPI003CCBE6CD